jgi:hypothetical protein
MEGNQLWSSGHRVGPGLRPGSSGLRFDLRLRVSAPMPAAPTQQDARNEKAVGVPTAQGRPIGSDELAIVSAQATTAAKEDAMIEGESNGSAVTAEASQADAKRNGSSPPEGGAAAAQALVVLEGSGTATADQTAKAADSGDGIAGMSVLRGLVVYAAVLAFAALYVDCIYLISQAKPNSTPNIAATLTSAAAALAGVLGSAFALRMGNPGSQAVINQQLAQHLDRTVASNSRGWWDTPAGKLRLVLSLEPSAPNQKSWPITFGIWVYAIVGSAVAVTYALNQHETPGPIKALAVAFAGYVIALLSVAFGVQQTGASNTTPPSSGANEPASE